MRFHLASECTTSAGASLRSFMGKVTALSVPLRSSFIPSPLSTKRGAVTLLSLSSVDIAERKKSFIFLMACSVWGRSSAAW